MDDYTVVEVEGGYRTIMDDSIPEGYYIMFVNDEVIFAGPAMYLRKPIPGCTILMSMADYNDLDKTLRRTAN